MIAFLWLATWLGAPASAFAAQVNAETITLVQFREQLTEQVKTYPGAEAQVSQMIALIGSPNGLAILLLVVVFFLFFLVTALPAFGGAVGAKLLSRD